MDRDSGLIHVRIQSWFPLQIQVSSKVSRIFRRLHTHGLIAKISRTHPWRVTLYGRRVMGAALYLRDHNSPMAYSTIAA